MSPVPLCDRDPPTKVTSKKGIVKVMITTRMARILSTRDRIEFHDRFGERELMADSNSPFPAVLKLFTM